MLSSNWEYQKAMEFQNPVSTNIQDVCDQKIQAEKVPTNVVHIAFVVVLNIDITYREVEMHINSC